jgi:hypothetical protein
MTRAERISDWLGRLEPLLRNSFRVAVLLLLVALLHAVEQMPWFDDTAIVRAVEDLRR